MISSKSFEKLEQALCQLCQVGKIMDRVDKKFPHRKALISSSIEGKICLCQICWRNCFRLLSSRNKYPQLCSHRVTEIYCDLMKKCHVNKLKLSG